VECNLEVLRSPTGSLLVLGLTVRPCRPCLQASQQWLFRERFEAQAQLQNEVAPTLDNSRECHSQVPVRQGKWMRLRRTPFYGRNEESSPVE
jgi:hypothetical protein